MKKHTILIAGLLCLSLHKVHAQDADSTDKSAQIVKVTVENSDSTDTAKKGKKYLAIGSGGIRIETKQKDTLKNKRFEWSFGVLDLGLNMLVDKTDYSMPQPASLANNFEGIPPDKINKDLFALRNGRSWNVNIYPVMLGYKAVKQPKFETHIYTGLGLQIYNFRFANDLSFINYNNQQKIYIDSLASFTKDKLALNYLTIPLAVNFKHKIDNKLWLVYGIGASFGYRLGAWTKQVSGERGKEKNHDLTNFRDYNFNITGELGLNDFIRLYAAYQVTNIYKDNSIKQYPLSFGIRFGGI